MPLPRIALTMGDPSGIGPEICLKAICNSSLLLKCQLRLIGDRAYIESLYKKIFHKKLPSSVFIQDLNNINHRTIKIGKPSKLGGVVAADYIRHGVELINRKAVDALVTAPINKLAFALRDNKRESIGHTEYLAQLTNTKEVALMLASGNLRVVHVTSHVSLKEVVPLVTKSRVFNAIQLALEGARMYGISRPRIGVSALNPHGGDGGLLGWEEKNIIRPAIVKAQKRNFDVAGPIPSDVLWPQVLNGFYDIGVAMYHDQGQIPVKLQAFQIDKKNHLIPGGINVTLGLPFIRTSPAHGTAFDIAGKGVASPHSLIEAIQAAIYFLKVKTYDK